MCGCVGGGGGGEISLTGSQEGVKGSNPPFNSTKLSKNRVALDGSL